MAGKAHKTEFKTVSKRAQRLLNREEGHDVEFKASLGALGNADFVAFANSDAGGAILIGVAEVRTGAGSQKAQIVGCPVGDRQKVSIINRAESCVPPVDIEVFIENSNRKAFYRVEIPSGPQKPYCTSGGLYKIRGDGRTRALLPGRLLTMFAEAESQKFVERFKGATTELEASLEETRLRLAGAIKELVKNVEFMGYGIEESLNNVFGSAQEAQYASSEAMLFSDEAVGSLVEVGEGIDNIRYSIRRIDEKIDALMSDLGVEDPEDTRFKQYFKSVAERIRAGKPDIKKRELLRELGKHFSGLTKDEVRSWYDRYIDVTE